MKRTGILILAAMLLCTACAGKGVDGQETALGKNSNSTESAWGKDGDTQSDLSEGLSDVDSDTSGSLVEVGSDVDAAGGQGVLTAVAAEAPLWAQGTQTNGALYTGLNLDGIGESDDEVYVSTYLFGDIERDSVTVLRIHLGTGEVISHIFSVCGSLRFRTGRLFSQEKEAILLELAPPWNSDLTYVFVIDVSQADDGSDAPEAVVRLDCLVQETLLGSMTAGTEIVDMENSGLQGLNFYAGKQQMEDGTYVMANRTICWTEENAGEWMLADEYESVDREFDAERGSHEIAGTEEPLWAQGIQTNGALFEGLNLDGVGEADDAVYVSSCCFGDYEEEAVTVLWVHLGTGETEAEVLSVHGDITLRAGRLYLYGKDRGDGILLEIHDGQGGNEDAVYAVDIFPARHFSYDPYPLPFLTVSRNDDAFFVSALEDEETEDDIPDDNILHEDIKMEAEVKELFRQVLLGDASLRYVFDRQPGNVNIAPYFVPYVSDGAKAVNIADIPLIFDEYDQYMEIQRFAIVDLDGDGEDEVLLFVCGIAGDMSGKVILHRIGDEIYGYRTGWRTMYEVKKDGTYDYADDSGLIEGGIVTVTEFSETDYTVDKLFYETGDHKDGWTAFFVNDESATEEEYRDADARQDEKPDVEWYEFTGKNINAIF